MTIAPHITASEREAMILKAFLDVRYGDGTSDMLEADANGSHTHEELAMRFGLSRQAVSLRISNVKLFLRRVAEYMDGEGKQASAAVGSVNAKRE